MRVSIIFTVLILSLYTDLFSKNFYLSSSSGNDSYTATEAQNPKTPWKTIGKLNNSMSLINPGDSVLFKRGDSFHGQIVITCSGTSNAKIVFSAYGTGKNPEIKGTIDVDNWSPSGKNIYMTNTPELGWQVTNFFINGKSQQIGRYPNAGAPNDGYLSIESHVGNSQISCSALSAFTDLSGAEAVVRTVRWILERQPVQTHSSNTIVLAKSLKYEPYNNRGFFIQNHLSTLDEPGEWYYDASSKKIYVYSLVHPDSLNTEATSVSSVVEVTNQKYITIENLVFIGSTERTFNITSSTGIDIKNNEINDAGFDAIYFGNSKEIVISDNTINNTNNNGVEIINCSDVNIRSNQMYNTSMRAGMGKGSDGMYYAMVLLGDNITSESNIMDTLGYCGYNFGGDSLIIRNNYISNFCLVKDDGSAIYTASEEGEVYHHQIIENNIIMNGIGNGYGTYKTTSREANGIYLDNRSQNITVIGNTIANCNGRGIYLHNASNNKILGNTAYNNSTQIAFAHSTVVTGYPIYNIIIRDNIFYAKSESQLLGYFQTLNQNELSEFGTFENNSYCRPTDENNTIETLYYDESSGTYIKIKFNLKSWQDEFKYDLTSTATPSKFTSYTITELIDPNIFTNSTFDSDVSGWGCWSKYNNGSVSWDNSGKLDGGCMKINFDSPSGESDGILYAIGATGEIHEGNYYILNFSMGSSQPGEKVDIVFRRYDSPYNLIAPQQSIIVNPTAGDYELLFAAESSVLLGSIDFQIKEDGTTYWIDNVEFHNANIRMDSVEFIYNVGENNIIINDGNKYIDPKGEEFSYYEIKPNSSLIYKPIYINPESNNPPTILFQSFQVSELDFELVIDSIQASDQDGDILKYKLVSGNESGLFILDSISGQLSFSSIDIDFTGNPTFSLLIRVTDDGDLFDEQVIPVYLYAKDENIPPSISPQFFQVSELDFSQVIDTISATDKDGDNISYTIISGNEDELFNLNVETGQLSFSSSADINFIGNPSYILGIRVTDDGTPAQFSDTEITISLYASVVDNPPEIDNQVFDILENDIENNFIGVILAEAGDDGQSIQYFIESGNEQGLFSLDAESGNLYFTTYPRDFYSIDQYELHVRVTDNGPNQLSDIATISINLIPSGNVYYIDPDNTLDIEIDGSKEHPFNSWNGVSWEDGATYVQKCGTEAKEDKLLITADNVTIGSYGTGQLPVLVSSATDYAIKVLDKHDIIVKNLQIIAEGAIGCVYFLGEKCENNVLEHCKLEGADYGLRMIDGISYTVKYNVFNNNVDGIYTIAQDAEIFYNVFKGNQLAVNLSSYSVNAKIYNNVFYDNRQGVSTSYAEILLYNNIFYMTQSGDQALNLKLDQLVSDNNIFYPEQTGFIVMKDAEYGSLTEYQDLTGLDLNSMTVDPLFMDIYSDNFSVTKESHAIDAGKLVGLTQDFYGKAVPSGDAPDIGLAEAAFDMFTSFYSLRSNESDLWSVYPNPSTGKFSVRNNQATKSNAEILIYDVSGDIIYQQMFNNQGMQVNEINLTDHSKGVYILSIESENKKQTQKLIIQ